MVSKAGKDWIPGLKMFLSPITAVGSVITMSSLDFDNAHWFANLQFYTNVGGGTLVEPGAGTVSVMVETINNEGSFEAPPVNTIEVSSRATVSWNANTRGVQLTPAGITTATHYRAILTSNRT